MKLPKFFLFSAALLTAATCAHAATVYWDNNGALAGFGTAGGNWGTDTFWNTVNTGTGVPTVLNTTATSPADAVNFGNGATGLAAGTVNVTGTTQGFGLMTFASGSGAITLSGGTLNLAAATTITVNNASDTINSVLAGGALSKAGTGTLILSGNNTYTGATNVNAGTLVLKGLNTGAGATTVSGGATLNLDFSTNITNIIKSGNAITLGGGTFSLTGSSGATNSQTLGTLTLSPGDSSIVLTQNGATSLSLALGGITRTTANAGTVNFSLPTTGSISTTATNTNGILGTWASVGSGTNTKYATKSGSDIVALTGTAAATAANLTGSSASANYDLADATGTAGDGFLANTIRYTGAAATTTLGSGFTINGLMNAGTGLWTIGTNPITIGSNKELVVNTASNGIAISSVLQDNGTGASGLTKTGADTLTLSGANTYTGVTAINAGTVIANNAGVAGTSSALGKDSAVTLANAAATNLQLNANLRIGSLSGGGTTGGNVQLGANTLTVGASNTNTTYAGVFSSTTGGTLIKMGTGNLTLTGNNATHAGGITVSAGVLSTSGAGGNNTNNLGTGPIMVQGGGTLAVAATTGVTWGTVTLNGAGASGWAGALVGGAASSQGNTGSTSFVLGSDATIGTTNSGSGFTVGGAVNLGAFTLTLNPAGTTPLNISGVISGTGGVKQIGSVRTTTLSGANTYTGATTIDAGTLIAQNVGVAGTSGALGKDSAVTLADVAGANLQLNASLRIGSLAGGGTTGGNVNLQGNALTVGADNTSTSYAGVISGSTGALTKMGAGVLTLSGNNSYGGTTTVTDGTLRVNGALGNTAVTVSGSATLGGTGAIGGTVSIGGTGTLSAGASIESLTTGSLSMTSGTTLVYEAANSSSTGADLTAIDGTLSLSGVSLNLDSATLAALASGSFVSGDKLTLISYEFSGAEVTSGFTGYTDDSNRLFGSNEWAFNYNDLAAGNNYGTDAVAGGQNRFVTLTMVPEPTSALLVSLGALALLRRRR